MAKCAHCNGSGLAPDLRAEGVELRRARKAAGLSLRALASHLNLSAAFLSDVERGNRRLSSKNRKRLQTVLLVVDAQLS